MEESDVADLPLRRIEKRRLMERVALLKVWPSPLSGRDPRNDCSPPSFLEIQVHQGGFKGQSPSS